MLSLGLIVPCGGEGALPALAPSLSSPGQTAPSRRTCLCPPFLSLHPPWAPSASGRWADAAIPVSMGPGPVSTPAPATQAGTAPALIGAACSWLDSAVQF